LYVGNLSTKTKEEDLRKIFSKYGNITDIQLLFDPHTNKYRGFGFVNFEDNASADEAEKQLQNYVLDGKEIKIEKA
ncbi:hypothetical protein BCR32DRAFT_194663, partial [Anaeromyces robustus]